MVSMNARDLVLRYVDAYRTGDTTRLGELIAEDFVDHLLPQFRGPSGVARAIEFLHSGFGDIHSTIEHIVCSEEMAAFQFVLEATAKSGQRVKWIGADFMRIRDGKISEVWSIQRRERALDDFPAFIKTPANAIAASSQLTQDIEGWLFD